MNMDKSPIALTEYEYSILKNNHIISMCCARQLKSATINEEGIELSLTFQEESRKTWDPYVIILSLSKMISSFRGEMNDFKL